MRLLVVSDSDLESGVGHKRRLLAVLDAFAARYGRGQVDWIDTVPVGLNLVDGARRYRRIQHQYKDRAGRTLFVPRLASRFVREVADLLLSLALFLVLLVRYGRGRDLVIWSEMTLSAWPYLLYARWSGVPLVVDMHGTVDELLVTLPPGRSRALHHALAARQERRILGAAQGLVAVSHAMVKEYERRLGRLPAQTEVVPTFADRARFEWVPERHAARRAELGLSDAFVLVYSGGVQAWQGVDRTLDFFAAMAKRLEFHPLRPFLLFLTWDRRFGTGAFARHGLAEGSYRLEYVTEEAVPQWLAPADAGLLLRDDTVTNRVSCPTKAGEYLLSGLPLLCSSYAGDLPDYVRDRDAGFVWPDEPVDETSWRSLASWAVALRSDRHAAGARCREAGLSMFGDEAVERLFRLADRVAAVR